MADQDGQDRESELEANTEAIVVCEEDGALHGQGAQRQEHGAIQMISSKIKGRSFAARLGKTIDTWVDVKNVKGNDLRKRYR